MSNWINWRIAVIRNRELSAGAKGIALYLNTYMNDRHDFAFPTIATICGEMNLSNKTAIKYLAELAATGFLVKRRRYGKSIIYYAAIPEKTGQEVIHSLGKSSSCVDSPLMEELHPSCVNPTLSVVEDLHTNKQENKQENKQKGAKRFAPPNFSQVEEYCRQRKNSVDPQAFLDHYEANGWMRGKTKIRDWQACVRTWERSAPKNGTPSAHKAFTEDNLRTSPEDKAKAKADLERLEAMVKARKPNNTPKADPKRGKPDFICRR